MREDVGRIHEDLSELRAEDRKTAADARTLEVDLKQTLAELTAELRVTNANLQNLDGSIASLGNSVAEVSSALVRSTERQQDFERWVAVRLGPIEPSNIEMTLPSTWTEGQEKIFDTLAEGSDPLTKWYSGLSTR
jgi:septal ring factor EnvC (AmiA/AmiB activator)